MPDSQSNSVPPVNNPATLTDILPVDHQGEETPDEELGQAGSDPDTVPDSQSNADAPVNNPITKPGERTPEVVIITETKSPTTDTPVPRVLVVIAGDTISLPPSTSKLLVAGTTLSVNGPAATVSGQVLSLADGGLIVGTQTHSFLAPAATAVIAVGDQTFSRVGPNGAFVVAGSTISPGAHAIEISGVVISLNPSAIIYGSSIVSIPPFTPTTIRIVAGAYI